MGTHPIFESDFDCLTDQKNQTKIIKNEGERNSSRICDYWPQVAIGFATKSTNLPSSSFRTRHDRREITILVFCIILQKSQQNRWRNYFSEKGFGEVANCG